MMDIFLAFFTGAILGYAASPRDKDFKEQREIYIRQLKEMQGNIDFYKKWCKQISAENAEYRRKQ